MEGAGEIAELFPEAPTLEDAGGDQGVLDHMLKAREDGIKFMELMKKDDWKPHTDKNGVVLETREYEGSDLLMSKVTTEVNVSATNALKAFRDFDLMRKVDGTGAEIKDVKSIDNANRYYYYCIPSMFLVSARDAFNFAHEIELEDDSYLLMLIGVDVPDFDRNESAVEMKVTIMGAHFEELDDDKCRMTKIAHVDLGGSIPTTFINWMIGANHTQWKNLKDELES